MKKHIHEIQSNIHTFIYKVKAAGIAIVQLKTVICVWINLKTE